VFHGIRTFNLKRRQRESTPQSTAEMDA
jgi:hypothetical protein